MAIKIARVFLRGEKKRTGLRSCFFGSGWCGFCLQRLTHEIAGKTPNDDVLPELGDLGRDQFFDRVMIGILDEALLEQANRSVKLVSFPSTILVMNILGFALVFHLRVVNLAFALNKAAGTSSRLT